MILMIDNYDSFTYNLYQMIGAYRADIQVVRNDAMNLEALAKLKPSHLVISPGPKYPKDAGVSLEAISYFHGRIPILGVCLGHQAIGEAFGGKVISASEILHGKSSRIRQTANSPILRGLEETFVVGRYHSLIVERVSLPEDLEVIAEDDRGEVMALAHVEAPTYGVQFHPESILTPQGQKIIENFLEVK